MELSYTAFKRTGVKLLLRIDMFDEDEDDGPIPALEREEPSDTDRTKVQGILDLTASLERRHASLIVISGSATGKMFKIPPNKPVIIGRSKHCDIPLDDDGISRQHAKVEQDPYGNVAINDLKSTNGTFFDGTKISRHILQDGDKIQLGSITILKFSFQDSLEEAFHQNQYEQATRDGLTGIYNKKYFLDRFSKEFSYAQRHSKILSLVIFDIDHFKNVNDTFGHPAGDVVLRQLAELIYKNLRTEDTLARFGGEEFTIMLREEDEQHAHLLSERLRVKVEKNPFAWGKGTIPITISIGIATLRAANFRDANELFKKADEYLYQAKRAGRNRVCSAAG
jgi:two-component system, cell cycle response regulator